MYQGKKISVAIASYNGEAYLSQQLDSILGQSVPPDEIVISDDGSTDRTLEIARQYAAQAGSAPAFVILTDNPRHGIGGNFEWALRHATGDYIFICGQDDVWLPEKVRRIADVFISHPEMALVCHDLACIDTDGMPLSDWKVNSMLRKLGIPQGSGAPVPRSTYLEPVLTNVLISGPAVCISKQFVTECLPIPSKLPEDWWTQFCAVALDKVYYWNEVLTYYRIHNSASHSVGLSSVNRIRKTFRTIRTATKRTTTLLQFSESAEIYLDRVCKDCEGYSIASQTLRRIAEIGTQILDACGSGRITGAVKLTRLYFSDMRYRRIGRSNYLTQLANILLYSRSKRREELK